MKSKTPMECATNGMLYSYPYDMDEGYFYTLLEELLTFCKVKGLTVKQAQILLKTGAKYIADSTLV